MDESTPSELPEEKIDDLEAPPDAQNDVAGGLVVPKYLQGSAFTIAPGLTATPPLGATKPAPPKPKGGF